MNATPFRRRRSPHGTEVDVSAGSATMLGFYLSGTLGKVPVWVLLPVLQSFKELGNWLASSEAAGLLRFLSSSQLSPAGDRKSVV